MSTKSPTGDTSISTYRAKRNFTLTAEPAPGPAQQMVVVQTFSTRSCGSGELRYLQTPVISFQFSGAARPWLPRRHKMMLLNRRKTLRRNRRPLHHQAPILTLGRNLGLRTALCGKFPGNEYAKDGECGIKSYARARETTEKALNAYIEGDEKDERQTSRAGEGHQRSSSSRCS
jgi:hypothetical protein